MNGIIDYNLAHLAVVSARIKGVRPGHEGFKETVWREYKNEVAKEAISFGGTATPDCDMEELAPVAEEIAREQDDMQPPPRSD